MLFLFFCPASVYQQSFLGGEQTAESTTSTDAPEQHRDQQRKPIRLATFEFDFKKQHSSEHNSPTVEAAKTYVKTELKQDRYNALPTEAIDTQQKSSREQNDRDEVDFTNGNRSGEDNSIFFSPDYLQDIHNLSRSMHDLIDNLNQNENVTPKRRLTSRSATSSLNSIPGNLNSSPYINDSRPTTTTMTCNHHNSPICQDKRITESSSSISENHGDNKRNGNSLNESKYSNSHCQTPKSSTKYANNSRLRYDRKNLRDMIDSDDFRNSNVSTTVVSTSSEDSWTNSSPVDGNDIETSDSFVNIQFVRLTRGQKSSSTQSMESTDSFENVSFRYAGDTNDNSCSRRALQIPSRLVLLNSDNEKPTTTSRIATLNSTSKSSKLDNQSERKIRNSQKVQESKCMRNEPVKLRHERYTSKKNMIDSRNTSKNKRYSCFSPCVANRSLADEPTADDKMVTRKFNSTDELRDVVERQKPTTAARTKRFSLYYTPQPLRKTYEGETRAGKIQCKSVNRVSKPTETSKTSKDDERMEKVAKKTEKSRKSVVDASTVASRSKSSRQNVHMRASVVNMNPITGRTK